MTTAGHTNCPVCSSARSKAFEATILARHRVAYLHCEQCGLLQTEDAHWLPEAYASPVTALDTDLVARNQAGARKLSCVMYFVLGVEGRHLDFAGGYGLLTRMLRDVGFDAFWFDPYCENLFAKGFEREANTRYRTASAFEVLEHVQDPMAMLRDLLDSTRADTLFLSTELYQGAPPPPGAWDYYALDAGQHISFYQARTLRAIAERLGLRLWTDNVLHVMTSRKASDWALSLTAGRLSHLLHLYVRARMRSRAGTDRNKAIAELHARTAPRSGTGETPKRVADRAR